MTKWNGIGIWNNQVEKPSLYLEIFEMKTESFSNQQVSVLEIKSPCIQGVSKKRGIFVSGLF